MKLETKSSLLILACFMLSLLLVFDFYVKPVEAVTIETATFGATGSITSTQFKNCEYVSTTIVWCATTTGAYIWNPTIRAVSSVVYSGLQIYDVECDSTYCFTWHLISDGGDVRNIANLTMFLKSGGSVIDSYLFNLNTGAQAGYGITLVPAQSGSGGTTTILAPVEGQTCLDDVTPLGNTDDKGICFIAVEPSNPFPLDGTRFINSGATSDTAVNYDVIWNGNYASIGSPTANRAEIKHRDAVGNFQYYNINLADSDSTFALTQVCNSGTVSGGLAQQSHMIINDGVLYDGISNDIWTMDTTNSSCAEVQKTNPVDESIITGISFSATDNIFLITSTTDGSVETNSLNVFNATTFGAGSSFDRLLKLNLTSTANNFVWFPIVHQSEGEVHVWRGTQMLIISELLTPTDETDTSGGNSQNGRCGVGTVLDCIGDRSVGLAVTGGSDITTVSETLFCGIGFNSTCSGDPKENGTGLLLMLITGVFFSGIVIISIATANTRFGAGIAYTEIPKELWLFLVVGVVSLSFYFQWIPDIVFYGMMVGLAGLFSFGLYKHIRGG